MLHNYRVVDDAEELIAVGTARLSPDDVVTAMDLEVSEGPNQGRVVVNDTGTYLGTQALGRSASSDGHQWIRLDGQAGVPIPESLSLRVKDESAPLREVQTSTGTLTVLPASGSFQTGPGGSYVARVGEVWVDEGGDPRRRVTHTFVRTNDGQELRYWGYADRDDTVDVDPPDPVPNNAMPAAAAVQALPAELGAQPTVGARGREAASAMPVGLITPVTPAPPELTCTVTFVLDPAGRVSGIGSDCPPGVEMPGVLSGPTLDDPPPLTSPDLDDVKDQLRDINDQLKQANRDAVAAARLSCYYWGTGILFTVAAALLVTPIGLAALASTTVLVVVFLTVTISSQGAGYIAIFCRLAHGDPHIRTADGLGFELQAVGEFVTTRSDLVTVQQRFEGDKGRFTAVSATAVAAAGNVVEVRWSTDGPEVVVNGDPVDQEPDGVALPGGGSVQWSGDDEDIGVVTPDGSWVWVATAATARTSPPASHGPQRQAPTASRAPPTVIPGTTSRFATAA